MKIAYLITAFGNYQHLKKLVDALNDGENVHFFIHIDKKKPMPEDWGYENLEFIKRRNVWWGGWSHTAAILDLMKASLTFKPDYHVLLSGSDFPIRPNYFLYNQLNTGKEFFNIIKGFHEHKPEERIKYHYFDTFDRRDSGSRKTKLFKSLEKVLGSFYIKKNYPFVQIYHGSTWWALTNGTVKYILTEIDNNPKLIRFFKSSWCPEESLIPTIIGNSNIKDNCRNNITFTDWSTNPAPSSINKEHLRLFKEKLEFQNLYGTYKPFFARKFDDDSNKLIQEINNILRA